MSLFTSDSHRFVYTPAEYHAHAPGSGAGRCLNCGKLQSRHSYEDLEQCLIERAMIFKTFDPSTARRGRGHDGYTKRSEYWETR